MLDQETRYAHWSSLLSTRTRHFLPEGPKCFSLESPGGRRYHFFSADIVDQRGWSNGEIIVINPLRCVKLVLSTLSCVSVRISWEFLTEGHLCFPQKETDHWIIIFSPRWNDARCFILRRDDLQDNLQLRKGKWSFYFCDEPTVRAHLPRNFSLRRN